MTNERDTEKLSAWLDGEPGAGDTGAMRRRLADDPAFARGAAECAEIDALLRRRWNSELEQPLPLSLARTVREGFARRRARGRIARLTMFAAPLAASVAIVVVGLMWAERNAGERWQDRQAEIAALVDTAVQEALETVVSGTTVSHSADTDRFSVSVTPMRTYRSVSENWCREFEENVVIAGETVRRLGLACREADGGWRRIETRTQGAVLPPI